MTELKPYPEYKDSGVEWIGKIPKTWKVIKLKYVANFNQVSISKEDIKDKTWYYYDIPTIQARGEGRIENGKHIQSNKYLLNGDEVLISKLNPRKGSVIQVKKNEAYPIISSTELIPIVPKSIYPRYLFYQLSSSVIADVLNSKVTSVTNSHQRVNPTDIASLNMILPPYEIQMRIAKKLDAIIKDIENLISFKKSLIKLLEEKRQAVITETVTKGLDPNVKMKDSGIDWIGEIPEHWDIVKLKFIGDTQMGLLYSPNELANKEKGRLVLRASNIQNSRIDLNREDNVYVDKEIPERLVTQVNDILICARSGSRELIGKSALINNEAVGKTFGAFTTVFRSEYNDFVSYVFQSGLFQSQIGTYLTSTINQLTISNLRNLKIVLPPRKEQEQLVSFLNKYDKNVNDLINLVQEQVSKLKKYRESLIYEAVTGKIDLRDYECDEEISEV